MLVPQLIIVGLAGGILGALVRIMVLNFTRKLSVRHMVGTFLISAVAAMVADLLWLSPQGSLSQAISLCIVVGYVASSYILHSR